MSSPRLSRRVALSTLGVVACTATVGCSQQRQSSATYPSYESLEQLVSASSLVAQGTVGRGRRTLDGNTPVALFNLSVTRCTKAAAVGQKLTLVMPDTKSPQRRGETSVSADRDYVLFLDEVTVQERDGLADEGTVYSSVGGPQGIFTVDGDRARPVEATTLTTYNSPDGERLPQDSTGLFLPLERIFG
ncbi:hypothetical protein [Aestuariimicrobium ganziense]|uniref:hypothetical protein n=1 Tax=Aestuariimicrobium ganziense TaxID=2773677 RepID=UPI001944B32F|nr:hypothetical protein [Aestuariimicrobium ganziense]